jgi:hypothetical protein
LTIFGREVLRRAALAMLWGRKEALHPSLGSGLCRILDMDFRERLTGEVRRISLLGSRVNKIEVAS